MLHTSKKPTLQTLRTDRIIIFFGILLPFVALSVFIYQNAINVPYMDDMDLVDTMNMLKDQPSNFFSVLVRQQNDHRILFSRLGTLIVYFFDGVLNFKHTILLGYICLPFLLFTLYLVFKSEQKKVAYFLPVVFILFSPFIFPVHLWSLTAFEHTLSIAFSIAALYFLQPHKTKVWYYSLPLVIASCLSSLDGLNIIPAGLLWLLLQKRIRETFLFSIFSGIYLYFHFTNFKFSPASKFPSFSEALTLLPQSFVAFVGSYAKIISDTHALALSLALGILILGVFIYILIIKRASIILFLSNYTIISLLRVFATAAMIALGRSADGAGGMMASRFNLYSASIAALFYLFLLRELKGNVKRYFFIVSLIAFASFNIYSYYKYKGAVLYLKESLKVDTYNFPNRGLFIHQYLNLPDPHPNFYRHYDFPEYFSQEMVQAWENRIKQDKALAPIQFTIQEEPNTGLYEEYIYPLSLFDIQTQQVAIPTEDVYLILTHTQDSTLTYLAAVTHHRDNFFKKAISTNLTGQHLSASIPQKINTGPYDIGLCWMNEGKAETLLLAKGTMLN